MKSINPRLLKHGDVFTKELKLHGREAFEVYAVEPDPSDYLIVGSKNEDSKNRRRRRMYFKTMKDVILLRSIK